MKINQFYSIFVIFLVLFSFNSFNVLSVDNPAGNLDFISITSPSALRGETATVNFVIKNLGNDTITTEFESTPLTGPGTINAPSLADVDVVVGENQLSFQVDVPSDAAFGTYTATLTATDSQDPQNTDSIQYQVTVTNALEILDLRDRSLSTLPLKYLQQGENNDVQSIKVKNNGDTALTVSFSYDNIDLTDNDGDEIDLSFSPSNPTIQPGQAETVELTFDVPRNQDIDVYEATVKVSDISNQFEDTLKLDFEVIPDICDDGVRGENLVLDINNPDNNDDFKPGETVDIDVTVDNDGDDNLDVGVEAFIVDKDGDEIESQQADRQDIKDGRNEDFEFNIDLSRDSNDFQDDELIMWVKAYDDDHEDEQCTVDKVRLDVRLERDDVDIKSTRITPTTASCGDTISAIVDVINVGKDNQKDTFITLENSNLGIREVTERFEVEEFDQEEDAEATKRLSFVVPPDAEDGSYPLDIEVHFGSGDIDGDTVFLTLMNCGEIIPEEVPEEALQEGGEAIGFESGEEQGDTTRITGGTTSFQPTSRDFLGNKGLTTAFWIIGDIVLLVIALFFIILIFKRTRNK